MKFLNSKNFGMLMTTAKATAGRRYRRVRFLKLDPDGLKACSWCTKNGWHTARYLYRKRELEWGIKAEEWGFGSFSRPS